MTITWDWVMWLLAAICFLLGAISVGLHLGRPDGGRSVNWMCAGFMFIAIAQLN